MTSVILKTPKFRFRGKVAIFDFDWTLVKPKSNGTFPKDEDDWMWLRPNVPIEVEKYYNKGYCIIIMTNQSKLWKVQQIQKVLNSFKFPTMAIIAMNKEEYKPNTKLFTDNVVKYTNKSFFCGDALGRPSDFSDSDKVFAENLKLPILTPEEAFPFENKDISNKIINSKTQEIILMVGYPGSGKSYFAEKQFENDSQYIIIHGDEYKTSAKMIKAALPFIKKGKSIIFDATNSSKEKRSIYIDLAKQNNIGIRCIHINTSMEESLLQNNNREKPVPKITYYVYRKHFEEPTVEEGFTEVLRI